MTIVMRRCKKGDTTTTDLIIWHFKEPKTIL